MYVRNKRPVYFFAFFLTQPSVCGSHDEDSELQYWSRMQRNNSGIHQACAACKHQRKKCSGNCVLAPYFPATKSGEFNAVHKVFGVSNITKLVKGVPREEDRRRLVTSLIWEAFCRQKDPILGSYGEYEILYNEYRKVLAQLMMYKNTNNNQILQLPSDQGVLGWNESCKGMHRGEGDENDFRFVDHDLHKNNGIIDSPIYNYQYSDYSQDLENLKPEIVNPFQHHHQPCYINSGGQFNQMSSKSMEAGSICEGGLSVLLHSAKEIKEI